MNSMMIFAVAAVAVAHAVDTGCNIYNNDVCKWLDMDVKFNDPLADNAWSQDCKIDPIEFPSDLAGTRDPHTGNWENPDQRCCYVNNGFYCCCTDGNCDDKHYTPGEECPTPCDVDSVTTQHFGTVSSEAYCQSGGLDWQAGSTCGVARMIESGAVIGCEDVVDVNSGANLVEVCCNPPKKENPCAGFKKKEKKACETCLEEDTMVPHFGSVTSEAYCQSGGLNWEAGSTCVFARMIDSGDMIGCEDIVGEHSHDIVEVCCKPPRRGRCNCDGSPESCAEFYSVKEGCAKGCPEEVKHTFADLLQCLFENPCDGLRKKKLETCETCQTLPETCHGSRKDCREWTKAMKRCRRKGFRPTIITA